MPLPGQPLRKRANLRDDWATDVTCLMMWRDGMTLTLHAGGCGAWTGEVIDIGTARRRVTALWWQWHMTERVGDWQAWLGRHWLLLLLLPVDRRTELDTALDPVGHQWRRGRRMRRLRGAAWQRDDALQRLMTAACRHEQHTQHHQLIHYEPRLTDRLHSTPARSQCVSGRTEQRRDWKDGETDREIGRHQRLISGQHDTIHHAAGRPANHQCTHARTHPPSWQTGRLVEPWAGGRAKRRDWPACTTDTHWLSNHNAPASQSASLVYSTH